MVALRNASLTSTQSCKFNGSSTLEERATEWPMHCRLVSVDDIHRLLYKLMKWIIIVHDAFLQEVCFEVAKYRE